MTQFSSLGLAEPLLQALTAEGYSSPTPIQAQVIPHMLAGQDILGIAQTGTGKTASFVLPLLNHIHGRRTRPEAKTCSALILAPTRELATQIAESVRTYGQNMRHSVTVIVGGVKAGPQIRAIKAGLDIVVATPGRLLDHLQAGDIRLDATTQIVLDEADQMLDMGFIPAIRRIMAKLPAKRQTVLLSATMPTAIRALAHDFMKNPREISVTPVSKPIERIDQRVLHVEKAEKRDILVKVLRAPDVERAIVFTRTKHGADRVSRHLQAAGLTSAAIHGNKSQNQRDRALGEFRDGKVRILVATDVAARGIDIDDVSHVVNFELPNIPEAYVHRIGRTARAGKSGVAISLCDAEERGYLRDIEKLTGCKLSGVEGEDLPPSRPQPAAQPTRNAGRPQQPARAKSRRRSRRSNADGQRQAKPEGNAQQRQAKPDSKKKTYRQPSDSAPEAGLTRLLGNIGRSQTPGRTAAKNARG